MTMTCTGSTVKEHTFDEPASTSPPRSRNLAAIAKISARIRRYNPDVDPNSDTFKAAVLLLAALEYGQNIDVLARRTGFDRSLVARCVRRLIDNGVWQSGRAVTEWSPADEACGSFWNDVAVAEGKMCRRAAADGSLEWAPAGFWNKNFHFVDAGAANRQNNLYLDPLSDDAATGAREEANTAQPASPAADLPESSEGEADTGPAGSESEQDPDAVPSLDRVFRNVVWIG